MHSRYLRTKFIRVIEIIHLNPFLLLCLLCDPVFGSTKRFGRDSSSVGEVLLRVLGGPFAAVSPENEVSSVCREHSEMYLQALYNFTPWAINMYDSSTNIPSGLVTGNIQQLGNYDQCLSIEVWNDDRVTFRGQQCRATVQFAVGGFSKIFTYRDMSTDSSTRRQLDMRDIFYAVAQAADVPDLKDPISAPYSWAFCVPSTCSAKEVESALNESLLSLNVPGRIEVMVSVQPNDCHVAQTTGPQLSGADIGMIFLLALVALLIIVSTSYDLIIHRKLSQNQIKSVAHDVLMSFSVYTNSRNLMSTSTGSDTLTSLNGLRFLSIFWILLGHTYYMKSVSPNINHVAVKYFDQSLSMMLIMNATVTTDTFFLLSGILLCYVFMRQWDRKPSFNITTFYIHRYLRLTPPYAFVIFFYVTLLYRLGSGSDWDKWVGKNREFCVANWWTNLLYVNNYTNVWEMCLEQTWYLAVNMQLFWVSPLMLYPLAKWPRFGKGFLAFVTFTSVVIPFAITFSEGLTAAMLYTKNNEIVSLVYLQIYTRTYARAGPYLIGIALGYLLHALKDKPIYIPKVWVALGWLVSLLSSIAVVLGAYVFYDDNHEYNASESSVYAGLHRSAWALSVAWIAFACIKGYGGPVNMILSWKLFVPLGRLTYCAYLCHYIILLVNIGSNRTPGYLTEYTVVHEFAGNLMLTLLLATAISLSIEMPFINLNRILIKGMILCDTKATTNDGRSIQGVGNETQTSSSSENKHNLDKEKTDSAYVLPQSSTYNIGTLELKSYENAGFDGNR